MPRVEGSERLALPRADVWRLLNDPDTLGASIPGCRGFERDGDAEHRYRTAIKVAVGAVTGVYEGTVEYTDIEEPDRCTIVVDGKGDKGSISGSGELVLAEADGATEVTYRGDFRITGPVAGVGQRMAPGVSRKMIVETLRNLERHGSARPPVPTASAPEREAAPESARRRPASAPEPATTHGVAPAPAASQATEEAFRPFALSPGVAFASGCLVGGAVVAVIALIL